MAVELDKVKEFVRVLRVVLDCGSGYEWEVWWENHYEENAATLDALVAEVEGLREALDGRLSQVECLQEFILFPERFQVDF